MAQPYEVFISFRGKDTLENLNTPTILKHNFVRYGKGLNYKNVFFANTDCVPPHVHEIEDIANVASNAKRLVVVWSTEYFSQKWCLIELISYYLNHAKEDRKMMLIVPQSIQYDMQKLNIEEAKSKIESFLLWDEIRQIPILRNISEPKSVAIEALDALTNTPAKVFHLNQHEKVVSASFESEILPIMGIVYNENNLVHYRLVVLQLNESGMDEVNEISEACKTKPGLIQFEVYRDEAELKSKIFSAEKFHLSILHIIDDSIVSLKERKFFHFLKETYFAFGIVENFDLIFFNIPAHGDELHTTIGETKFYNGIANSMNCKMISCGIIEWQQSTNSELPHDAPKLLYSSGGNLFSESSSQLENIKDFLVGFLESEKHLRFRQALGIRKKLDLSLELPNNQKDLIRLWPLETMISILKSREGNSYLIKQDLEDNFFEFCIGVCIYENSTKTLLKAHDEDIKRHMYLLDVEAKTCIKVRTCLSNKIPNMNNTATTKSDRLSHLIVQVDCLLRYAKKNNVNFVQKIIEKDGEELSDKNNLPQILDRISDQNDKQFINSLLHSELPLEELIDDHFGGNIPMVHIETHHEFTKRPSNDQSFLNSVSKPLKLKYRRSKNGSTILEFSIFIDDFVEKNKTIEEQLQHLLSWLKDVKAFFSYYPVSVIQDDGSEKIEYWECDDIRYFARTDETLSTMDAVSIKSGYQKKDEFLFESDSAIIDDTTLKRTLTLNSEIETNSRVKLNTDDQFVGGKSFVDNLLEEDINSRKDEFTSLERYLRVVFEGFQDVDTKEKFWDQENRIVEFISTTLDILLSNDSKHEDIKKILNDLDFSKKLYEFYKDIKMRISELSEQSNYYDVFLSHAGEQKKDYVSFLNKELIRNDYRPFLDYKSLNFGDNGFDKMINAAYNSKIGYVCMSKDYLSKKWPIREFLIFWIRYKTDPGKICMIWEMYDRVGNESKWGDKVTRALGVFGFDKFPTYGNHVKGNDDSSDKVDLIVKSLLLESPPIPQWIRIDEPGKVENSEEYVEGTRLDILNSVEVWINNPGANNVFHLIGGFGMGKSIIASKVIENNKAKCAFHFFIWNHSDRSNLKYCIKSVSYQLAKRFPEFAAKLPKYSMENLDNDQKWFDDLLLRPAQAVTAINDRYLVVIDAADECKNTDHLKRIFFNRWNEMPKWLLLFVTSRPEKVLVENSSNNVFSHTISEQRNDEDLRLILKNWRSNMSPLDQADEDLIIEKAKGSFLYLFYMKSRIQDRDAKKADFEKFPTGLIGVYEDFTKRIYEKIKIEENQIEELHKSIFGVLVIARDPLPEEILKMIVQQFKLNYVKLKSCLSSLLNLHDNVVEFQHKSYADWLTGEAQGVEFGMYFIDLEKSTEYHQTLSSILLDPRHKWSPSYLSTNLDFLKSDDLVLSNTAEYYSIRNSIHHIIMGNQSQNDKVNTLLSELFDFPRLFVRVEKVPGGLQTLLSDLRSNIFHLELSVHHSIKLLQNFLITLSFNQLLPSGPLATQLISCAPVNDFPLFKKLVEGAKKFGDGPGNSWLYPLYSSNLKVSNTYSQILSIGRSDYWSLSPNKKYLAIYFKGDIDLTDVGCTSFYEIQNPGRLIKSYQRSTDSKQDYEWLDDDRLFNGYNIHTESGENTHPFLTSFFDNFPPNSLTEKTGNNGISLYYRSLLEFYKDGRYFNIHGIDYCKNELYFWVEGDPSQKKYWEFDKSKSVSSPSQDMTYYLLYDTEEVHDCCLRRVTDDETRNLDLPSEITKIKNTKIWSGNNLVRVVIVAEPSIFMVFLFFDFKFVEKFPINIGEESKTCEFSPDGMFLVILGESGIVYVFSMEKKKIFSRLHLDSKIKQVDIIRSSLQELELLLSTTFGEVIKWNVDLNEESQNISIKPTEDLKIIKKIEITAEANYIVCLREGGRIEIWMVSEKPEVIRTFDNCSSFEIGGDNKEFLAFVRSNVLNFYSFTDLTCKEIGSPAGFTGSMKNVRVSNQGDLVALQDVLGYDSRWFVYRVENLTLIRKIEYQYCVFSADFHLCVSWNQESYYSPHKPQILRFEKMHQWNSSSKVLEITGKPLNFSPCNKFLSLGYYDRVEVYDVEKDKIICMSKFECVDFSYPDFRQQDPEFFNAMFSVDSNSILVFNPEGEINLWKIEDKVSGVVFEKTPEDLSDPDAIYFEYEQTSKMFMEKLNFELNATNDAKFDSTLFLSMNFFPGNVCWSFPADRIYVAGIVHGRPKNNIVVICDQEKLHILRLESR